MHKDSTLEDRRLLLMHHLTKQSLEETRPMKPTICSTAQNGQEMQDPYNNTHAQGSCQQYVIVLLGLPDRLDQLFQYHYSSSWYFSLLFPLYLESSAKGRNFILFYFIYGRQKLSPQQLVKYPVFLRNRNELCASQIWLVFLVIIRMFLEGSL